MPIRRVQLKVDHTAISQPEYVIEFSIEPFLMGGGAEARKPDPCGPVRATSILGQVRWFWRLMHHDLPLEVMREREAALFGAAARTVTKGSPDRGPAPFAIEVESTAGKPHDMPEKPQDAGGYLLFSARRDKRDKQDEQKSQESAVKEGVTGSIRLAPVDGVKACVLQAVRLWALLGGVGSRTRRGVGAVQVTDGPASVSSLEQTLRDLVESRCTLCSSTPVAVTSSREIRVRALRGLWIGKRTYRTATACLYDLEKWLKEYRQHRRTGSRRFGRSYWDEPEEIRKALGQRAAHHKPLDRTTEHPEGWARAALGLPIVFEFKRDGDNSGDPVTTQLEGLGFDRMASPLLFRPVKLTPNEYVAVVALLGPPYQPPKGLVLRQGRREILRPPLTSDVDGVFAGLLPELGPPLRRQRPSLELRRIV